jgi:hypothetical protein
MHGGYCEEIKFYATGSQHRGAGGEKIAREKQYQLIDE